VQSVTVDVHRHLPTTVKPLPDAGRSAWCEHDVVAVMINGTTGRQVNASGNAVDLGGDDESCHGLDLFV
jgi:hypothetical protein